MGLEDEDVLELADLVPSPGNAGLLSDAPLLAFPPRYRAALALARGWLAAWKAVNNGDGT
jgi:hypothetical protein